MFAFGETQVIKARLAQDPFYTVPLGICNASDFYAMLLRICMLRSDRLYFRLLFRFSAALGNHFHLRPSHTLDDIVELILWFSGANGDLHGLAIAMNTLACSWDAHVAFG